MKFEVLRLRRGKWAVRPFPPFPLGTCISGQWGGKFRFRLIAKMIVACFGIPSVVGYGIGLFWAWLPVTLHPPPPNLHERKWLVLIGRTCERKNEEDTTVSFRNSRLALYRNEGSYWKKTSRDLPVRSLSTALYPPQGTDGSRIARKSAESSSPVTFGYMSIPYGLYHLDQGLLRGRIAFLISDWGRHDGVVKVFGIQNLYTVFPQGDQDYFRTRCVGDMTSQTISRTEKTACYLHGTITRQWAFRDTLGCITMFDPQTSSTRSISPPSSDWDEFLELLQFYGITNNPEANLSLAVTPLQTVLDPNTTELKAIVVVPRNPAVLWDFHDARQ